MLFVAGLITGLGGSTSLLTEQSHQGCSWLGNLSQFRPETGFFATLLVDLLVKDFNERVEVAPVTHAFGVN